MFEQLMHVALVNAAAELMEGVCCEACNKPAEVFIIAIDKTNGLREVAMCKGHMLDPGPLLDW